MVGPVVLGLGVYNIFGPSKTDQQNPRTVVPQDQWAPTRCFLIKKTQNRQTPLEPLLLPPLSHSFCLAPNKVSRTFSFAYIQMIATVYLRPLMSELRPYATVIAQSRIRKLQYPKTCEQTYSAFETLVIRLDDSGQKTAYFQHSPRCPGVRHPMESSDHAAEV
ncbi:MAG: hypothetical protein M2R45_00469 [Verrucomicrobia subdivision 3 bacterium]|nr:hypothetical protein [Limisphaerales bacterium]